MVWRCGESGGDDGMWDNSGCCSGCDVFLCVIGRTGEGYSEREATLSREGRARARVAGRSSSLGAGDSVSREGGLDADVGVDEPDPDDDGSCALAFAFFLISWRLFCSHMVTERSSLGWSKQAGGTAKKKRTGEFVLFNLGPN